MKKIFFLFFFFNLIHLYSQVDYSNSWEDFFSYNNVKDFIKVDNTIYALVDNAVFTYNESTNELTKFSSIKGLSGESTSAIYYSKTFKRLVIGYENGLVEVIDDDEVITRSSDILNFNQSGSKRINHISEFGNKLYLSTPFAIVEYNIDNLEFGDTFFIGNNSTSLAINEILVNNSTIYAATENGIFSANVNNTLLIDFNNWTQEFSGRNFSHIEIFNNAVFVTENTNLFQINNGQLNLTRNFFEEVKNINATTNNFTITLNKSAIVLNSNLLQTNDFTVTNNFDFTLSNALLDDSNTLYLGTQEFGILKSSTTTNGTYEEIHPEGPLFNETFDIAVKENNLWVVYGGYDLVYAPRDIRKGFSHFNGQNWINTKYDPAVPYRDLVSITIDPNAENRVFISSFGSTANSNSTETGGLLEVENDVITNFYNQNNSPLQSIETNSTTITIRIGGTAFDNEGNLWVTNVGVPNELKKLSVSGQWTSYDVSSAKTRPDFGLSQLVLDRSNNVWFGTRGNGVIAFNESSNTAKSLITTPNLGSLPDANVNTVAVDRSNRIWLGTRSGMVVFRGANSIFSSNVVNAQPVIIEENGIGERLLGDQFVNTIAIDGADNKWFGTDKGGVVYTNPSGLRTIANFSIENSPLPSNRILKIAVDNNNGKVYFATDKGIVAYDSKVSPFADTLGEVYAYPNPSLKNHNTVTIDVRNGTSLPKGTNVKILDVAGNLVYETNVIEGQQLQGGKVVWDKTNLSGKKVASGIYIVLLSTDDGTESTSTKIAIVN
ncbi:MAG: T9SS type A sorting domain-containing protein [Flavobacteriaceae bacterium]|nr:T9SS type A sorting domain-containing protein [Flavobacteriaceae bacterium]